jgi:glucose-6-phosphate 1-dehydrogenase
MLRWLKENRAVIVGVKGHSSKRKIFPALFRRERLGSRKKVFCWLGLAHNAGMDQD